MFPAQLISQKFYLVNIETYISNFKNKTLIFYILHLDLLLLIMYFMMCQYFLTTTILSSNFAF